MERKNFGKLQDILKVPDLITIQRESYDRFFEKGGSKQRHQVQGFDQVFREIFPIESIDQQCSLDFVDYEIHPPREDKVSCLRDGGTYAAPLHVTFRLNTPSDSKEEKVYMGDMPIMTEAGTFVVNGAERVIVSQLHRSPGVCFEKERHPSGRALYSFRVIPDRGSWMEVQFDIQDHIYIFLDRRRRRRRFLISTFLRALGCETNYELLDAVYKVQKTTPKKLAKLDDPSQVFTAEEVVDPRSHDSLENIDEGGSEAGPLLGQLEPLTEENIELLEEAGVKKLAVVDTSEIGDYFIRCVQRDGARTTEEALKEIYRRLRPGDPPNVSSARQLLSRLFFDLRRYDLGLVGRYKINQKLGLDIDADTRTLMKEDLIAATAKLMELRHKNGSVDDIDHLGNRRVRTVGELLQNHCRVGLMRTERLIRERMTLLDMDSSDIVPGKLVNPKAFASVVRDFFARNQLSQFMDQTNCLAELTNKRRLSALGPGGLTRERAGFEVRDIHTSHYGRVCPIETPEGPNIGLISSLALYARTNPYGFVETPYRRVKDGVVTGEVDFLTADLEENFVIAQANAVLDEHGRLVNDYILCRYQGEPGEMPRLQVQYMDVSPKQLVSAAAGLVPFLEHDDANRALMGANMQRQALPLIKPESPFVGTGLESEVARDSRSVVRAEIDGVVAYCSADKIITTSDGKPAEKSRAKTKVREYQLVKFMRSNASTLVSQRPMVKAGDKVQAGDIIADGSATAQGELALGRNVLTAFMPWCGYNFEDAIVINERLVKDDVYTNIQINQYDITARDTKLGPEEITRDIPNVNEDMLRNLDHEGVVRVGAEVHAGDILVGKITPKSETELAPEERLLRAIFGEKASDVKDSSLYMPYGSSGIVMDVRTERRVDPARERISKAEIKRQIKEAENAHKSQTSDVVDELTDKLAEVLLGSKINKSVEVRDEKGETSVIIPANRKITKVMLKRLAQNYDKYEMSSGPAKEQIEEIITSYRPRFRDIDMRRDEIIEGLEGGDGYDPGVLKSVKVYVATKRKVAVGDKLAGRHGNKGIIARIVPEEDLPFMADGTPVDIVLNPLGVPSRMNVGQVLEAHLGWVAKILGLKVATPVFDGISEEKIVSMTREARQVVAEQRNCRLLDDDRIVDENGRDRSEFFLGPDGKATLYDGRTGEPFSQRVMIGYSYVMKLDHMVADKIHARAVGPYSLVTQQPLGGKAQHGGQRFGEMEVWALEAYGAAHTLQEMLTVKSDDVQGRTKIYDSILKGENALEASIPESFNVLTREMQSLGLDIRVRRRDGGSNLP